MKVEGRGGRNPCVTYLPTKEICIFVPPCSCSDSASQVVELDWGVGFTISGELACPTALHPRCRVVDIFPGYCLKTGHWPWWTLLLWWFCWSLVILYPLWKVVSCTTRSSLTVLAPLKWTWTPALPHMLLKLPPRPLEYGTTMEVLCFLLLFLCRFVLLCSCFWLSWNSNLAWSLWNTQLG